MEAKPTEKYDAIVVGAGTAGCLAAKTIAEKGLKVCIVEKKKRQVAEEIARFPEVQEVHIITGDWDLLMKLRAENVEAIGKFVVDKLRRVKGLEKTLTCMVFETVKESTSLPQSFRKTQPKS